MAGWVGPKGKGFTASFGKRFRLNKEFFDEL